MKLRIIPFIILLALAVFLAFALYGRNKHFQPSLLVGQAMPAFHLATLDGKTLSPDDWQGHVAVLNVFASWCVPCRLETPALQKLAEKAPVYGIAWKDHPEKLVPWLQQHGNPYKIIGLDERGDITIPLALSGVPETFIMDAHGRIAMQIKEGISMQMLNETILPLIERLNAQ